MLSRYLRYIIYVLLLAHIKSADGALEENQIKTIKAGVLVYKGKQTSCALAAVDSKAAVVAATCLDEQNIDTAPDEYSVYFNDGIDGKPASYNVESITIHPEYNPITAVNNIAVLQYNSNSTKIEWQNKIIIASPVNMIYTYCIRFALEDVENMTWAQYSYIKFGEADSASCNSLSPLYAKNEYGLYCTNQVMDSSNTDLSKCPLPYSLLYDNFNSEEMHIAGIYSFSVLSGGNNLCSYKQQRSYFTLIGFYQEYLSQVLNRDMSWKLEKPFMNQLIIDYSKDPNYSLNKTDEAVSPGNFLLSGDLYINQTTDDASSTGSASKESESNDLSSEGTSASGFVENNSQDGSSHIVGIIAGTCIGAVGLASICGAIYYIRWKRKKSPGVADPMRNNDFQNMLEASRPGRTTVGDYDIHTIADYDLPPVYEEIASNTQPSATNSNINR
ncbi:hypothetical protein BX667DRAFT_508365 [Coemansia mojavensis]|nr:hypothetical protein BX667DRAFT_508365 [Coemansia mojavensis]